MPKRYSLGLVMTAVMTLAGCGLFPTASSKSSSVGNSAVQLMAASAVQFGTVPVGSTGSSSVVVSNAATDGSNITVSRINVTGSSFQLSTAPSLPLVIAAGQNVTLGINFSPKSRGSINGLVSITSDASDQVLPVVLRGNGNAGQISVSPAVMSFGSVGIGGSGALNGTLTAANSSVTISTVDQTGQGYALSGISFPVTLAAGQSVPFTVTFTPQAPGTAPGSLAFMTDASDSATTSLNGSGSQSGGAHTVALSWSASSSPVAGYNIYRSQQSGGPYAKMTGSPQPSTSYADTNVQSGSTYFYVATSVNSSSEESGYSNQTAATIP